MVLVHSNSIHAFCEFPHANQCCLLVQLIACGVAVATYNDGATDFRDTPAYKESQSQEFPEESESSSADVFEGNPTEVAPVLE